MSRYVGPNCRFCRREGAKLFLKGERCNLEKCAFERRSYAPGQHGQIATACGQIGRWLVRLHFVIGFAIRLIDPRATWQWQHSNPAFFVGFGPDRCIFSIVN